VFTRLHLFAGVHYRMLMFHSIIFMHAPRLLLDASVDNMISRFKSGHFRIGSDDSIFLTTLNALSCSEPHSTLFGALFLVNSVKEALSLLHSLVSIDDKNLSFQACSYKISLFWDFQCSRFAPQIHLKVYAISLQCVTHKFDLV